MVKTLTLRPLWIQLTLPALIAIRIVGCGSGGTPIDPSELAGTWGAENVVMTVTDVGAHLELSCAHGDVAGALTENPFSVGGTWVREVGPVIGDPRPALYTGSVVGDTMTLSIRLTDTNESVGSFTLIRGAVGRLVKCV